MNRKIIILFLILGITVGLLLVYQIIETYALFYSKSQGRISQKAGNWTIKVNNTDVTNKLIEKFNIEQLQLEEDENVKEGKMAPGMSGNFCITIDPTNTDVSIRYDIVFDTSLLKNENMKIVSVENIDSDRELVQVGDNAYTGVIPLSDIRQEKKDTIKVILKWEEIEEYNEQDTELGKVKGNKINIPITLTITQYLGEEIISI